MQIFVNDLSINNQYSNPTEFISHLTFLISLRKRNSNFGDHFICPRGISEKVVCNDKTLRQVVLEYKNKDFTTAVLTWLDRSGPFLEGDDDDYGKLICEINGTTLEDCVIENVATKVHRNENAKTYSFDNCQPSYSYTPLSIGYTDNNGTGHIHIENIWNEAQLDALVCNWEKRPESWEQLIQYLAAKYSHLMFSQDILGHLSPYPFSSIISERAIVLMEILDNYVNSHDANKIRTKETNEIIKNFFSGEKAPFTDESVSNIRDFNKEMTFDIDGKSTLCSWHGKIKHQEFRIHFQYPFDTQMEKIFVAYIGPKITKK
ncbi:TPA: hypothetical protein MCD01_000134 [Klebsiella quasipneumoniae]|uniref:hypothetical protein n=1 Tax=Klebsiella quasipneumoniae TaxID=1463165 RepID=UPI00193A904D|nr:hypothetical protein [Klebsiella quasipneumoniae]HBT0543241.1 hypothetical protein [Klebsiella pneumoniae]MBM0926945.1 hypothetical protein [Klebsiella quasipneumoniae]MCU8814718.1 hypothetical protein [Klebsiella quasipneumoniae]HBT5872157.1 hypothetical protein [Klebsiella quasipneumoniae]HBT5984307.1 hypothetical protein [Klebsiella quasipneumoniae]